MKKIERLKLSQLSKDSLAERQMSQLIGGNYCYWSMDNYNANNGSGVCSCDCGYGSEGDYYSASGLNTWASYLKQF